MEVVAFETDVPEVGNAALSAAFSPERPLEFSGDTAGYRGAMRFVSAGDLGVDRFQNSTSMRASTPPLGIFVAWWVRGDAAVDLQAADGEHRFGPGAVVCTPAEAAVTASWASIDCATVRLTSTVVDRVARERTGREAAVSFDGWEPVSSAASRRWRALMVYLEREATAADSVLEHALVQVQLSELVAGTALATFSNSAVGDAQRGGVGSTAPAAVRRAVAHMEAHAQEAITLTDIAEAARVTPRALQRAFERHLESTPMAHLRRLRLEGAHRELVAADPASGATVRAVALAWGFANPRSFATRHREAYGCSPGETLSDGGREARR